MYQKIIIFILCLISCKALFADSSSLVAAARTQIGKTIYYDPSYQKLDYPLGDVPLDRGVCSDVVIRALRKQGVDLQKNVHQDMQSNFSSYPKIWGLKRTDSNIDHRRVPNLETYFTRQKMDKPITDNPDDYKAGDIVSWRLNNGLAHIGIVSDKKSSDNTRPLIIHNIGAGTKEGDLLFAWKIVGHYRYFSE